MTPLICCTVLIFWMLGFGGASPNSGTKSRAITAAAGGAGAKCSAELQGILFEPQTFARQYLEKVAAEFGVGSGQLFGPNANAYIANFEQKWGVELTVADPMNICTELSGVNCIAATENFSSASSPFNVVVNEDFSLSSVSVFITGDTSSGGGMGKYTLTSPSGTSVVLANQNICSGETSSGLFSFGFTDGSMNEINCQKQNAGTMIAPEETLSKLNGESSAGTWSLALTGGMLAVKSVTLTLCQPAYACPRNVMKALTNVPGFRFDSAAQMAYYTEDIYDASGRFKQVTISRCIEGI